MFNVVIIVSCACVSRNHTSVPGGRRKRKGSLLSELWPNADIPYEISKYYGRYKTAVA